MCKRDCRSERATVGVKGRLSVGKRNCRSKRGTVRDPRRESTVEVRGLSE